MNKRIMNKRVLAAITALSLVAGAVFSFGGSVKISAKEGGADTPQKLPQFYNETFFVPVLTPDESAPLKQSNPEIITPIIVETFEPRTEAQPGDETVPISLAGSDCFIDYAISAPVDQKTLLLSFDGETGNWFRFVAVDGGYHILYTSAPGTIGLIEHPYLGIENGVLVYTDEENAAVWAFENGTFSATVTETRKTPGFWFFFWYYPGKSVTTTKTFYLSSTEKGAALSEEPTAVTIIDRVYFTRHNWRYVDADNGTHCEACTNCGKVKRCCHTYDETTHTCVCGAVDPLEATADVTVHTNFGWKWGFFFSRIPTFEYSISAIGNGAEVTDISYSFDGFHYVSGTEITSFTARKTIYINVTLSNGVICNYTRWSNGSITENYKKLQNTPVIDPSEEFIFVYMQFFFTEESWAQFDIAELNAYIQQFLAVNFPEGWDGYTLLLIVDIYILRGTEPTADSFTETPDHSFYLLQAPGKIVEFPIRQ